MTLPESPEIQWMDHVNELLQKLPSVPKISERHCKVNLSDLKATPLTLQEVTSWVRVNRGRLTLFRSVALHCFKRCVSCSFQCQK
jgi:hypothetical protein